MQSPLFNHYGSKVAVGNILLPLPRHEAYIEPFVGGGTLFFLKEKSEREIINDMDSHLMNFYRCLQKDLSQLQYFLSGDKIRKALQSKPRTNSEYERAALYFLASTGTRSAHFRSQRMNELTNTAYADIQTAINLLPEAHIRLRAVEIKNQDVLRVLSDSNAEDAFAFIDPPYIYKDGRATVPSYPEEKFNNLLAFLNGFYTGKFALTCYPTGKTREILRANRSWQSKRTNAKFGNEILITNY